MARAAVPGRLTWRAGRLVEARAETASARTLVLDVPGWPGHLAGQHVDVRLTAPDGYSAQRSYSIANAAPVPGITDAAPVPGAAATERVELTVQRVADGEVSPYLTDVFAPGQEVELRGPVGGWFVWRPADTAPVLLVAGGSGLVPLMAMVRTRAAAGSRTPFRLVYSTRSRADALYAAELRTRGRDDRGFDVAYAYTREGDGRLGAAALNTHGWPAALEPTCYVCGPTAFVETVADILVALGHDPRRVRTERFG